MAHSNKALAEKSKKKGPKQAREKEPKEHQPAKFNVEAKTFVPKKFVSKNEEVKKQQLEYVPKLQQPTFQAIPNAVVNPVMESQPPTKEFVIQSS